MITRQATMLDFLHGFHRKTKRRAFLETMDASVPWEEWLVLLRPYYYADYEGKVGRPPVDLELILRMYLLQVWFTLSDEGVEDEIYENASMAWFMGVASPPTGLPTRRPSCTSAIFSRSTASPRPCSAASTSCSSRRAS